MSNRLTCQAAFDPVWTHSYIGRCSTRCGRRAVVTPGPDPTAVDCVDCILQDLDPDHIRCLLEY